MQLKYSIVIVLHLSLKTSKQTSKLLNESNRLVFAALKLLNFVIFNILISGYYLFVCVITKRSTEVLTIHFVFKNVLELSYTARLLTQHETRLIMFL